jgi:hypothetical protein
MRPMALVGLVTLVALMVAGCGGSSSAPTPKEPHRVTTAAEVAEMTKRFEEDEELRPVYKAEREECESTHSEYEYAKACTEPLAEKLAQLTVADETLARELSSKVGEGCLKALRAGPYFDPIEAKTIAACKADVGKQAGGEAE